MNLRIYTVRPGDTLIAIARVFGMSLDQLLEFNPEVHNPNLIQVGQTILVPDDPAAPSIHRSMAEMNIGGDRPLWMKLALREEWVVEAPGAANNPRILEYHATTHLDWALAQHDSTPWCSSFVNWCIRKSGLPSTNSAWARSWLKWGQKLSHPKEGCIAVFSRGNDGSSGHVGFYLSETDDKILVLGGNQGNPGAVNRANQPRSRLLGYRWPA